MLVASHSGQFREDGTNTGSIFWYGDDKCGWDGCSLNLSTSLRDGKAGPVQAQYNFTGIPCPMDIINEDVITLCGIAYVVNGSGGEKFGAALQYFNCDSFADGEYETILLNYFTNYTYSDSQVCFELTYTVANEPNIDSCNSFFQVLLNSQTSVDTPILFSYSLHITRNCNPS
jgi:hypothetical protein